MVSTTDESRTLLRNNFLFGSNLFIKFAMQIELYVNNLREHAQR